MRYIKNSKLLANRFLRKWSAFSDISLKEIEEEYFEKPFDAYHPVGTCCMGEDEDSVVDKNLRVHGLDNVWLVSTAVLPSAGTVNPTFTVLCLAEQLINRISISKPKNI